MFKSKYWHAAITADVVLIHYDILNGSEPNILLVTRKNEPFKGKLALPGGFFEETDKSVEDCIKRELFEETGIEISTCCLDTLCVQSSKDRDPRERVVSIAYSCIASRKKEPIANDDALEAKWYPIKDIHPKDLAFDHREIIYRALNSEYRKFCYRLGLINPEPGTESYEYMESQAKVFEELTKKFSLRK